MNVFLKGLGLFFTYLIFKFSVLYVFRIVCYISTLLHSFSQPGGGFFYTSLERVVSQMGTQSSEEENHSERCIVCCTLPDLWMNCKPELPAISISQSLTKSNFWCVTMKFLVWIITAKWDWISSFGQGNYCLVFIPSTLFWSNLNHCYGVHFKIPQQYFL